MNSGPADPVTLINVFEVPDGRRNDVIAGWETARDFLCREPGYLSTALHASLAPDSRFGLVNVARWEGADAYRAAILRMQAQGVFPAIEGLRFTPALYTVIRGDGQ